MVLRVPWWIALIVSLTVTLTAGAATLNNDDSCDIAVVPAATLLLPYFEVDLDDPNGENTRVTLTNTVNVDAIARVTLWTDHAFPALTFNVYLTGYDAQAIDLSDLLVRGVIGGEAGTGTAITKRMKYSDPQFALDLGACGRLGGQLDASAVERLQSAFTKGTIPGECANAGEVHEHAVGYATIDVVANCSSNGPLDPAYWTNDLRWDNILTGHYEQIDRRRNLASASPLVHIRAIPEGGTPASRIALGDAPGFPRTFYERYQPDAIPNRDARQPLPSRFAARWIQGGASQFETSLNIWRQPRAGIEPCTTPSPDAELRSIVLFDERGKAVRSDGPRTVAVSSRRRIDDPSLFPRLTNGATAGWASLDFGDSQSWVVSSMRAEGRYPVDIEAAAFGNGCSAPSSPGSAIGPAPDKSPLANKTTSTANNDDSCDIALLPAATLLIPYFEVDFGRPPLPGTSPAPSPPPPPPPPDPTIFSITNVSATPRIARVTLWTDYAFPVLTFNVLLRGYDVQSISLDDVIRRGIIIRDRGSLQTGFRDDPADRFTELGDCEQFPERLWPEVLARVQSAFLDGVVPGLGTLQGCDNVGRVHAGAVGYATIDVVANCSANGPLDEEYWTSDLAYDNVLIGDYEFIDPANGTASGSPMVHIRAIPEGGTAAQRRAHPADYDQGLFRTFYSRFQPRTTPTLDARQPLPSVFAARWHYDDTTGTRTFLTIWREGDMANGRRTCATWDDNVKRVIEEVTFDDAENADGDVPTSRVTPIDIPIVLPATSRVDVRDGTIFYLLNNGAFSGWIYLNLDNDKRESPFGSSNWVVVTITRPGASAVAFDATAFNNGCTIEEPVSEVTLGSEIIGPAVETNPLDMGPRNANFNPRQPIP